MAAVLAYGPGAVLSHRSAAAALGLRPTARERVDISVPRRAGRSRAGIDVHRAPGLSAHDCTTTGGIACTTVTRTLLDLAAVLDRRSLEQVIDQAHVLRLLDGQAIERVLGAADGRTGVARVRELLAAHEPGSTLTRSELEERFLALCADACLPRPRVNARVTVAEGVFEVDFSWPLQRLIVETDGHAAHTTRRAFERDRFRDQCLLLAGWRVVRFTWSQIRGKPEEVAETVRSLLA